MVLKNNSKKVIGIGEVSILPGETEECPQGYENNPIVKKYIFDGTFSVVKETKKSQKQDTTGKVDNSEKDDGSKESGKSSK